MITSDLSQDLNDDLQDMEGLGKISSQPWLPAAYEKRGEDRPRSIPERVHILLQEPLLSKLGNALFIGLILLILMSTTTFILESDPAFHEYSDACKLCAPVDQDDMDNGALVEARLQRAEMCVGCEPSPNKVLETLELVAIIIFTAEYGIRLFTAWARPTEAEFDYLEEYKVHMPLKYKYLYRTRSFVLQPLNIVDAVTVFPYWLQYDSALPTPRLTVVRILRLFRIFRIFKLGDITEVTLTFIKVFEYSKLGLITLCFFSVLAAVVLGGLVFICERGDWDPATGSYLRDALLPGEGKEESPYSSIPQSFWWVVVTFTTIGYGDMSPTTACGQAVGAVAMYVGILLITMPITLMGANFTLIYERLQQEVERRQEQADRLAAMLSNNSKLPKREGFLRWRAFARKAQEDERDARAALRAVLKERGFVSSKETQDETSTTEQTSAEVDKMVQKLTADIKDVRDETKRDLDMLKAFISTELAEIKRTLS